MPMPTHEPSKATRDTVSLHAMVGTPQETIASILNIDAKTLRKYYREELDHALAKANATIGGSLFNKAKNGDTAAQTFWLKTRAGFREKQDINHSSEDGSMSPRITVTPEALNSIADKL
jgi:hypothetical protein